MNINSTDSSSDFDYQIVKLIEVSPGDYIEIPEPIPYKDYGIQDLVLSWVEGKAKKFGSEEEWIDYHYLDWLEHDYLNEIVSKDFNDSLRLIQVIMLQHTKTHLTVLALLEKLKAMENQARHVCMMPNPTTKIQVLILYLNSILTQNIPKPKTKRMRWSGEFSDFCEVVNILYDTKNITGITKIDCFRALNEIIEFESEKSEANFCSTSSQNFTKRDSSIQFWDEVRLKYEDIVNKKKVESEKRHGSDNNARK